MSSALSWNSTLRCKTGVLIAKNRKNAKFFRRMAAPPGRAAPWSLPRAKRVRFHSLKGLA
jgi:hypothetical protein